METQNLQLLYTLMCDDVRIEMGNKISLMGVFQNIMVEKLPVSLIKFAVINHWRGEGSHETEVRIVSPDKANLIVTSQPTEIELATGGYTDNVSFFVNVVFPSAGTYWVQTIADEVVLDEIPLMVTDAAGLNMMRPPDEITETVNCYETIEHDKGPQIGGPFSLSTYSVSTCPKLSPVDKLPARSLRRPSKHSRSYRSL